MTTIVSAKGEEEDGVLIGSDVDIRIIHSETGIRCIAKYYYILKNYISEE